MTLEIEASIADRASEQLVRTVAENGWTLKLEGFGFEEEQRAQQSAWDP